MLEPRTAPAPLIHARGLTRIYTLGSAEVVGVADVDLDIAPGEMVVLKGNSGSGKSTLLGLLAGLDRPTRGSLAVAGRDLLRFSNGEMTRYRRDVVGMVFQSFNLLPTLTVRENVHLPALLAGRPSREVSRRTEELLDWLRLTQRGDHLPSELSGGEMQRTAIARALINDPSIILADEPTGNLDSQNGEAVIALLTELNRTSGRTVIIATHSDLADTHATMRISLRDGKVIEALCIQ